MAGHPACPYGFVSFAVPGALASAADWGRQTHEPQLAASCGLHLPAVKGPTGPGLQPHHTTHHACAGWHQNRHSSSSVPMCVPAHMSTHTSVHMSTHMSTCLCTCLCTCLYTCLHTCLYTCLCTCLHTCLCTCLCVRKAASWPAVNCPDGLVLYRLHLSVADGMSTVRVWACQYSK